MRRTMEWIRIPVFAAAFALMTGCSVNSTFVYKPGPPAAGDRKLPVKVAVLPFQDGTENFTKRGSVFSDGQYNLAKTGVGKTITAMPPEFWGKAFADELAASGSFQSIRFVYSPSEFLGEGFIVDGILKRVYLAATVDYANELLVSFKATRMSDKKVVWEKEVGRVWKTPKDGYAQCGMGIQCSIDKLHGDWNKGMSAVLAEARMDLVATVASLEGGAPGNAAAKPEGKPSGESVEQTIDKILKGK